MKTVTKVYCPSCRVMVGTVDVAPTITYTVEVTEDKNVSMVSYEVYASKNIPHKCNQAV